MRPCSVSQSHQVVVGDCLDVLRDLEAKGERADAVYFDPPYGTGRPRHTMDDLGYDDTWSSPAEWGEWLRPRVEAARALLDRHGVLLASIGDEQVHRLRTLLEDVFGSPRAYLGAVVLDHGTPPPTARWIGTQHEHVLVFARSIDALLIDGVRWREQKPGVPEVLEAAEKAVAEAGGDDVLATRLLAQWRRSLPPGSPAKRKGLVEYGVIVGGGVHRRGPLGKPVGGSQAFRYDVLHPDTVRLVPMPTTGWRWTRERFDREVDAGRVLFGPDETTPPCQLIPLTDTGAPLPSVIRARRGRGARRLAEFVPGASLSHPKDPEILARLLAHVVPPGGLFIDAMAGSGAAAEAVASLGQGRRSISIEQDLGTARIVEQRLAALGVL